MSAKGNLRLRIGELGTKANRRPQFAWAIALIGCLLRLFGDLSASSGERMAGSLVALFGFVAVLWFYFESKIGNDRPPNQTE